MRGTFTPTEPESQDWQKNTHGGVYVDARGVTWTITLELSGGGLIKKDHWTAQSEGADDARRYITTEGWTGRARTELFDAIDAWVAAKSSEGAGVGGLLLVFAALWLLDRRGR